MQSTSSQAAHNTNHKPSRLPCRDLPDITDPGPTGNCCPDLGPLRRQPGEPVCLVDITGSSDSEGNPTVDVQLTQHRCPPGDSDGSDWDDDDVIATLSDGGRECCGPDAEAPADEADSAVEACSSKRATEVLGHPPVALTPPEPWLPATRSHFAP